MFRRKRQQTTKHKRFKDEPEFRFFVELYKKMNKEKDVDKLKDVGGVEGLAKALGVDVNYGIDSSPEGQRLLSIRDREEVFGKNTIGTFRPREPFAWTIALLRPHFLTPIIMAAIINTILGLVFEEEGENLGWITGVGIWIYVFVCLLSGLALDYINFRGRRVLNREKALFDVAIIRNGRDQVIKNSELLVGDILVLTRGVTVAADGVLFVDSNLSINEEVVTGDSKPIKKRLVEDPFCRSGTQVANGSGRILVTTVGKESELGESMKRVSDPTNYAKQWIGDSRDVLFFFNIVALCLGVLSFIVLLIGWLVGRKGYPVSEIRDEGPVHFLILSIIIIVMEVPCGFLLFDLFGYTYMAWKYAKDNIILHTPFALDKMSYVNTTCFDKTGTLTENRMTVVEGWFKGTYFDRIPKPEELDSSSLELITENASLNSEALLIVEEDGTIKYIGNQTECALLVMAKKFGVDYAEVRSQKRPNIIKNYGFDSDKKMSIVIVKHGDLLRLYNKGAAEMVLRGCTEYVDPSGSRNPIFEDKRMELENTIKAMASQGLRPLALTYVDFDYKDFNLSENGEPLDESAGGKKGFAYAPEEDLVLLAIVGIKDPIREGVSEVVEELKNARLNVRMMTGDNLETAKQVARKCGILTSEGLAMEGAEFLQKAEEDIEGLKKDLSQLQVLARASPSNKHRMVELLEEGEYVAVCGDGTNDAWALKESTIGIAMGTNSTEVAREAASVVILNDKISSVLSFYLLNRRYDLSFNGYFQFLLTTKVAVWIVVLVSVCVGGEIPLNAQQFLWAIFIMDILVVWTFITESPPSRVPDGDSYEARTNPWRTDTYYVHIVLQALYQIIVIVCTFCSLSSLFERYTGDEDDLAKMRKNSLMFNIFIFMQLFNSLNCRKVFNEYNIFEGLFNSPLSCVIRLVTIGLHLVVMLTPMGTLFKVTELNAWEWLYSMAVSVMVIPLSTFIRYDAKTKIIGFGSRIQTVTRAIVDAVF